MKVTKAIVSLAVQGKDRLGRKDNFLAYCTITLDDEFVVSQIKLIEHKEKGILVVMPSRKNTARCPNCGEKNHLKANFCNGCGEALPIQKVDKSELSKEIAHPITAECREKIRKAVVAAFYLKKG